MECSHELPVSSFSTIYLFNLSTRRWRIRTDDLPVSCAYIFLFLTSPGLCPEWIFKYTMTHSTPALNGKNMASSRKRTVEQARKGKPLRRSEFGLNWRVVLLIEDLWMCIEDVRWER